MTVAICIGSYRTQLVHPWPLVHRSNRGSQYAASEGTVVLACARDCRLMRRTIRSDLWE